MDQAIDIAERLELADVFALRRVSTKQLVTLAGVGRGEGWAGNISVDPVRAEKRLADALACVTTPLPSATA